MVLRYVYTISDVTGIFSGAVKVRTMQKYSAVSVGCCGNCECFNGERRLRKIYIFFGHMDIVDITEKQKQV